MKLKIPFKTPDAVHYAFENLVEYNYEQVLDWLVQDEDIDKDEAEELRRNRDTGVVVFLVKDLCDLIIDDFIRHGEAITVEIDLDSGEARVIPTSEV